MIERIEIKGRAGSAAYLDKDMQPVSNQASAEIIKVVFDDGEIVFLVPDAGNNLLGGEVASP